MTDDVITRLRAADPCPRPIATAADVLDRQIDAILAAHPPTTVGALSAGAQVGPPKRRHRYGWLVVTAIAVVIIAAGTIVAVQTSRSRTSPRPVGSSATPAGSPTPGPTVSTLPDGWHRYSSGFGVDYPPAWQLGSRHFALGRSASASYYFSSEPLVVPPCIVTTDADGMGAQAECDNLIVDLHQHGTLFAVSFSSNDTDLGPDLNIGLPTTVGGHEAVIIDGPHAAQECSGTGATTVYSIEVATDDPASGFYTIDVCMGPGDTAAREADVQRMLASITFDP